MEGKAITLKELEENNGEDGNKLWVLIGGKVYDCTNFKHPGGKEILMDPIGEDREDEFNSIHSPAAKEEMGKYYIGYLKEEEKKSIDHKKTDGDYSAKGSHDSSNTAVIFIMLLVVFFGIIFYLYKS